MNTRTRSVLLQCLAWLVLVLVAALLSEPAKAQMSWGEEYARRVRATEQVNPLGDEAFGDKINLFNGTISFQATDIDLPGNNALPVRLRRYYDPQDVSLPRFLGNWDLDIPHISAIAPDGYNGGFPVPATWATSVEWKKEWYWSGDRLNMVGGGGDLLVGPTDPKRKVPGFLADGFHTKDGWYFAATTVKYGKGLGYIGYAPDGTRYYFDWQLERDYSGISHPWRTINGQPPILYRKKLVLFVSEIRDRFGNWVKYDWDGAQLKRIHSNDGREIALDMAITNQTNYGRPVWSLLKARAGGREWTYTGSNVRNPDGTEWKYSLQGHRLDVISYERIPPPVGTGGSGGYKTVEEVHCSPAQVFESGQTATYTVEHPSGAKAEYSLLPMRHGRTMVKYQCMGGSMEVEQAGQRNDYATYHDVWSLQSKKVTGAGLIDATYRYSYAGLGQGYQPQDESQFPFEPGWNARNAPAAPNRKTVTVTQPDGTELIHTFGKDWDIDEGSLFKVQTRKGGVVHKTVTHTYVTQAEALGLPFPETMGWNRVRFGDELPGAHRPLKSTTTVQDDSTTYTWAVPATCNGNNTLCFDEFARPVKESKSNSMGYARLDATEYYDDLTLWVLGQVEASTSTAGGQTVVNSRTAFYPETALPRFTYGPCVGASCQGKKQSEMAYTFADPNGANGGQNATLASVRDGRGYLTALSDWQNGVPAEIHHPGTPEAPGGAYERAGINPDGTLAWVEDELDNQTCYFYDAAGRLARIMYPDEDTKHTCSTDKWLETTMSLVKATASAYGLPAGHWQHTVSTGDARKVVYLDAFLRPVVEEAYDAARATSTRSITVKRYDVGGQLVFQSYPQRTLSNYATLNLGTRSTYDALDRVVQVDMDSEFGAASPTTLGAVLSTTTDYQAGGWVEVKNPRGVITRTRYMAYDKPSAEMPVEIRQAFGRAEEAQTLIGRDPFGLPQTLTRRNVAGTVSAVRSYSYDVYRRLCRTVEPETGVTLMGWDDSGNPAWSAAGLPTSTACDATGATVGVSKVSRTFDARGRVTSLDFTDGRGNQDWTYTPDGLPATITTHNGRNSTEPVVNAYSYNARRQLAGESVSQPGRYTWNLGYGYNAYGYQSVSLTQPSGEVISFAPNALGQATQVTGLVNYATSVSYHPNGALAQFTYGNTIVHTMTQNVRGLPSASADKRSNGTWVHFDTYDYDQVGNVLAISDLATDRNGRGDRDMTYDSLDRLKTATSPMFSGTYGPTASYSYDSLDNLTRVVARNRDEHYCYDAKWQLTNLRKVGCGGTGATVTGLAYDDRGNLRNKNGQLYDFDYGNRLREAVGKETYRYDGHGRRVQSTSVTGLGDILSQYGQDGVLRYQQDFRRDVVLNHIYLAGSLIATRESPMGVSTQTIKYQHTDALGSPVAVTRSDTHIVERNDYEPFGALANRLDFDGPGYTAHVLDKQTGLNYMQQRYYDPQIGRFLSVDPVKANSSTGTNFNRYKYANSNPYRFTDPDGRCEAATGTRICVERIPKLERSAMPVVNAIVLHRTGGATADGAVNTWKSADNKGNVGAHFLVDKDGKATQTASTSMTTNHVGRIRSKAGDRGPFNPSRTNAAEQKKAYPDRYPTNSDSIGIEVVGSFSPKTGQFEVPTDEQLSTLRELVGSLQKQFGLTNEDVYRHGDISYKQPSEGAGLGYDPNP